MPGSEFELLRRRRTKIVATLGPASADGATINQLIEAGADVFRLNMSHGDHEGHAAAHEQIRKASHAVGRPIGILADLCGPKIRVGRLAGGQIELVQGETITVTTRDVLGGPGLIPSQYQAFASDVRPGCRVLLADGLMQLRVEAIDGTEVTCTVVDGGVLRDRKGINLPDCELSAPSLTDKDIDDARFVVELGVDFLALSFVRRASDVEELKSLLPAESPPRVIAKIERPEALDAIEEILDASDGIMVARGDLGVELPPEVVPVVQRDLVARARARSKPCIVATQMLESMIDNPRPTRAEVSDVSTAVFNGTDAVMLSAETASGRYPVEAVGMMDRIARQVEGAVFAETGFRGQSDNLLEPFLLHRIPLHDAVARSSAQLSRDLRVRAIVTIDDSDATARVIASGRPAAPIVAAVSTDSGALQATLLWGVVPVAVPAGDIDRGQSPVGVDVSRRLAAALDLAEPGDHILVVSGFGTEEEPDLPSITVLTI